ncbi:MAG TPA: protein kinase [Phycisphaerae bacterium]|nr:protein kinase [Phycisphaerae bacterium]
MSSPLHERAGELLLQALDLPLEERSAFVRRACGTDTELFQEVRSLLAASSESLAVVDRPGELIAQVLANDRGDLAAGGIFGAYRIRRRIAAGGMGIVYEAEQENPRRIVALKVMRRELAHHSAVRRFQFEVQTLARLRHAGIAQVYNAGVHEDAGAAIPYFAMEFIQDAAAITTYAESRQLPVRERLTLFADVCDAVHYGHQQGIIHRDLKPENVLVDGSGRPKVIDFGVARATEGDAPVTTQHTGVAQLLGTLPYMSPEQLAGDPAEVDTRTDVYSLGVILYRLLVGRLPVEAPYHSLIDAINALRAGEPPKLGSIDRAFRGDIETIVAKALAKDKDRRYASAADFAADIRRYLGSEPISARPPTAMYQLRKFARRNRGLVAGVAAAVVAVLLGAGVALQQAYVATRSRNVAREAASRAQREAYLASVAAASVALQNHDIQLARRNIERAPAEQRGWEWSHLRSRLDESVLVIPEGEYPAGGSVAFLGEDVVGVRDPGSGCWWRWDVRSGARLANSAPAAERTRNQSGSGAFWDEDGAIVVRNRATGVTHRVALAQFDIPASRGWRSLNLSNNLRYLAYNNTALAVLVDLRTEQAYRVGFDSSPRRTPNSAINDAGQLAFAGALGGQPALWDAGSDRLRALADPPADGTCVAFSPDGARVLVGASDATLRLWDARSGAAIAVARGHRNLVAGVRFSPDGGLVASVSHDRTLRLWDGYTLAPLGVLDGHNAEIANIQFNSNGTQIATVGEGLDRAIRVWDIAPARDPAVLRGHTSYVYPVAVSPDGRTIASGGWDNTIRLWDADTRAARATFRGCTSHLVALTFSPDGLRLLSASDGGTLRVWEVATGREIRAYQPGRAVRFAAFVADSVRVRWTGAEATAITVWDTDTGECSQRLFAELARMPGRSVSADGRFAVITTSGGNRLVRIADGAPALPGPVGEAFAFGPKGLATRFVDIDPAAPCTLRVWDLAAGTQVGTLRGHTGRTVYDIAFTVDGSRVLSAGDDQIIRVWDPVRCEEIVPLTGHTAYVWSLAFRPDGTELVSGSGDGTVRIWDTVPFAERYRARHGD